MEMKKIFVFMFVILSFSLAKASYENPPNACYENCTPWMQNLLQEFEQQGERVDFVPALYSGECHHLSRDLNPDYVHYSVVLLYPREMQEKKELRFASFFSFFAEKNEYADWDLAKARSEMTPYWKPFESVRFAEKTARVEVPYENGEAGNIYWFRQNRQTQELLYISFFGVHAKAFCRLKKH